MPKVYRCQIEVRGYELDSFGHVNHAVYLHYLEHARWRLLEEEGVNIGDLRRWNVWPVVAKIEITYLRPVHANSHIDIESTMMEAGRSYFNIEQKIFNEGVLLNSALVKIVVVNDKGRPTAAPDPVQRIWRGLPA